MIDLLTLRQRGFVNLRLDVEAAGASVSKVFGQDLPAAANTFSDGEHRIYWLGPDELLVATDGDVTDICSALNASGGQSPVVANDVSGGYLFWQLQGEDTRSVLAKGCTLDLHPQAFTAGQCAGTVLAKANVLLALVDETPCFDLIVRRSFTDYLQQWLAHSARIEGLRIDP